MGHRLLRDCDTSLPLRIGERVVMGRCRGQSTRGAGMRLKPCPWSFVSGMLVAALLGAIVLAEAPRPKAPTSRQASAPTPAPIVLSPDYERVRELIARLETLEAERTRLGDASAAGFGAAEEPSPRTAGRNWRDAAVRVSVPPGGYSTVAQPPSRAAYTFQPFTAENGSYYAQPNANGVAKTVHVRGYYRRDGTYVRGHYRSPPGSNR